MPDSACHSVLIALVVTIFPAVSQAQAPNAADRSVEIIDPQVLRVCADPQNMPLSNEKGEGIENKIAVLLAEKLGKSLAYTWYPQATGFVRNTLGAYKCDLIMGIPQGDDIVQVTNPYYRTVYALVLRAGSDLEGIDTLADPRLKDKRIGIVAGTPPSDSMIRHGLMPNAKAYPLMVDTRVDSSARDMIGDLESGEIDAAVLWGPMAGYFAKQSKTALSVVPLVKEKNGPRLVYRITMGVRYADQEWKRLLNRTIQENQAAFNRVLFDYGVPLLDDRDQPIRADMIGK
jgi:quinoprotein dehydrogenase-associated probable ABC transporter substrate-binding protein